MTAPHVDDLFSAAMDDELSEGQEVRFREHLRECSQCTEAYRQFTRALDSVHALPRAPMPLPVHLPPGRPAAERNTAAAWLRRLRPNTVPFGAATGLAAVAAVVIVVAGISRGSAPAPARQAPNVQSGGSAAARATPATCPGAAVAASPPAFAYRVTASEPNRPGQQLVIAAGSRSVAPGAQVQLFAGLTVPPEVAGPPGAPAAAAPLTVTPCLTVNGLAAGANIPAPKPQAPQADAVAGSSPANGALTFTVPPGTAPGTVLHVVASIPGGYPVAGQPPLSADLTLIVQ